MRSANRYKARQFSSVESRSTLNERAFLQYLSHNMAGDQSSL